MNASNRAISERVVVQCPACGASESAEAAVLADHRLMVCRECGETWPTQSARTGSRKPLRRREEPPMIVAEKQPLVTYTDASDTAWKAKIEGDTWPEPARSSRLPMTVAAVAGAVFLAAFFGARPAAVAALPDLAGLYSAIGMPVNLDGLAIEDAGAERNRGFSGARITLHATLRNLGDGKRTIPPFIAVMDNGVEPVASFRLDPPERSIAGGGALRYSADLGVAPEGVAQVTVRFLRAGESLPMNAAKLVVE